MEKKEIQTINIEDFKVNKHVIDYVDDDFAVVNNLEAPVGDDTVRLGCFLLTVCVEGCIQLDINNKTYQLRDGDLLLGLPNTIISHIMLSPRNKIRFVGFSNRFLQRVLKMERTTWNTAVYIYNNPVKRIGETKQEIFIYYRDLIAVKINDEPHNYHKEVMQYLFSALFCEILGTITKEASSRGEAIHSNEGVKQADYIFQRFIEKLSADNGMHRSVSYFADVLFYSPKYLSKVVKKTCGRTPLELINETAIEHIKHRLTRSDKSIKEIAEEFNFPNQSFFGKFVKSHTGMSPARYRNTKGG